MLDLRLRVLVLFALCFAAACSDDSGCPKVRTCDITESRCQRDLMQAVSCKRGGSSALPKVSVVSQAAYVERLASYDADDAEAEADYALWTRGLALYALAPVDYALDDARRDGAAEVAAAYFSDTKEIMVVDRGEPLDDVRAVGVFAHELVHALQDAEYDLQVWREEWAESFDEQLALRAIVEGEATLYQLLVQLDLDGVSVKHVDWQKYFSDWQRETLIDAEKDTAPVELADVRFPYAFGGALVARRFLSNGRAAIDALFEQPLLSTHEIMFGPRSEDVTSEQAALQAQALPELDGYEPRSGSALGAYLMRIFAAHVRVPTGERLDAARALSSDAFTVLYDPETDDVSASWCGRLSASARASWPGRQTLDGRLLKVTGSLSFVNLQQGTLCYLGSEQFAASAENTDWGPLAGPEDDQEEAARAAPRTLHLRPSRARVGCSLHIPELRSGDDASN